MSGQQELAWTFLCRGCGRRTWSAVAECAACLDARSMEPPPATSPAFLPVGVIAGLGWPAIPTMPVPGQLRTAVGWPPPAPGKPPEGEPEQRLAPAAAPAPAPAPQPDRAPSPIATGPADPPMIPLALLAGHQDPFTSEDQAGSWWDELLANVDGETPEQRRGSLVRHWHGTRAFLVIALVVVMAVLYSGLGLLVVWAVLIVPALLARLYRHRVTRRRVDVGSSPP